MCRHSEANGSISATSLRRRLQQFIAYPKRAAFTTCIRVAQFSRKLEAGRRQYETGKVYSLEYTEVPKVFLTPHHGRWRQQVSSLVTTVQRNCGLRSLLLERNNKGNIGIQGHCCEPTITSVATVCSKNGSASHCCNSVFQQWPRVIPVA
jgi:hypothetical protein